MGLILQEDDYEYPLWRLLNEGSPRTVRIKHVNVANISAALRGPGAFTPQALFVMLSDPPETLDVAGRRYRLDWRRDVVSVYVPAGP